MRGIIVWYLPHVVIPYSHHDFKHEFYSGSTTPDFINIILHISLEYIIQLVIGLNIGYMITFSYTKRESTSK